jgi:hypothetical protein
VVPVQIQYKGSRYDKNTRNSSFGKWISPINFEELDEQIEIHRQDYYRKKLTTESYIKLLLFSHLQETESLHALSDALLDTDLQKSVGFESISVSQLSRKNNSVEPEIFSSVFLDLVQKIQWFHQKTVKPMAQSCLMENIYRLDSPIF